VTEAGDAGGGDVLVRVERLSAHFPVKSGLFGRPRAWIRAVDDVSFSIRRRETLGLVGESGCGKSTLGRTLLALRHATGGTVEFDGGSVLDATAPEMKTLRRHMQLVFQDPFASLNPRETVGRAVRTALDLHGIGAPAERMDSVREIFQQVGLHPSLMDRFPHELSGGQRQRVGIARALVLKPKLLVCDEPVSALDVSIQAQILNLLKDLQKQFRLTYLFISHNLAIVEHMSDRVAVMYYGRIVEIARREALYAEPRHPYTKALLAAVPIPNPKQRNLGLPMQGEPPDPTHIPSGCRFRTRCPYAMARCESDEPALVETALDHEVACWLDG
jgi:peptide/nickel transport system ATP-binding protein/oligopeptide transport system ATP-binding protein